MKIWKYNKTNIINFIHYLITISKFDRLYQLYYKLSGYRQTPILMYHSVGESLNCSYNISLRAFMKQMEFVASHFRCIRLRDILKEFSIPLNTKARISVAITFDDAYQNLITQVHPIMEKYSIPYSVFIPTAFIGNSASWRKDNSLHILSVKNILKLKESGMVDFGSHTSHHLRMTSLTEKEMYNEASLSKECLSEILGIDPIDMFSYPYGGVSDISKLTTRVLHQLGYRLAVTSLPGTMNTYRDRFILRRIAFDEADNEKLMYAKLKGEYDWYLIKDQIMDLLRKIFNRRT